MTRYLTLHVIRFILFAMIVLSLNYDWNQRRLGTSPIFARGDISDSILHVIGESMRPVQSRLSRCMLGSCWFSSTSRWPIICQSSEELLAKVLDQLIRLIPRAWMTDCRCAGAKFRATINVPVLALLVNRSMLAQFFVCVLAILSHNIDNNIVFL